MRDRVVDLLGPCGRRAESQPADRFIPPSGACAVAYFEKEAAGEHEPPARDVAHSEQPGTAALSNPHGSRQHAAAADTNRRFSRERALVSFPAGRARTALWSGQPSALPGGRVALGGCVLPIPEAAEAVA